MPLFITKLNLILTLMRFELKAPSRFDVLSRFIRIHLVTFVCFLQLANREESLASLDSSHKEYMEEITRRERSIQNLELQLLSAQEESRRIQDDVRHTSLFGLYHKIDQEQGVTLKILRIVFKWKTEESFCKMLKGIYVMTQ